MQSDSFAFFHGYKVIYSISTTCNKWQYHVWSKPWNG